ncbi:MAG: DUF2069 domain-containing protein [Pseudomonadota bacterium]
MTGRLRFAYSAAIAGYFGLFSLLMLWNTVLAPSTRLPVALVLIFVVLPLLMPMRGMLHGRPRSCAWAAYLSLAYLVHGITEFAAGPDQRLYAGLEIATSVLLFFGAAFYVRLSKSS